MNGNLRNELCPCGSGKKFKNCCNDRINFNLPKDVKHIEKEIDGETYVFNTFWAYKMNSIDEHEDKHDEKRWYRPLCSEYQINRILNITNSKDYLLKLRADSILNDMRLYRVMINKYKKANGFWNFTNEYSEEEFNRYIKYLDEENSEKCSLIERGYIHSNDPNGLCISTTYGDIILISESLRHFLYFMNLYASDFNKDISLNIRIAALTVAIRIMLKAESMDFELDPRGEVPKEIDELNKIWVKEQLQFVIGHEYAHSLCGHLDKENVIEKSLFSHGSTNVTNTYKIYNKSQQQEFEADIQSLILPMYSNDVFEEKVNAAIFFFKYIDIFEYAQEIIAPSMNPIKTHPDPIERIWNIYENTKGRLKRINKDYINNIIDDNNTIKNFLSDDIGYNIEKYENYGSIYLGSWKKKMLRDRIDY